MTEKRSEGRGSAVALTRAQAIEFTERWFDRKWGNDGQYQSLMEKMVERLLMIERAEAGDRTNG